MAGLAGGKVMFLITLPEALPVFDISVAVTIYISKSFSHVKNSCITMTEIELFTKMISEGA